jgi:uncharacterized membrane-anchored protein
LFGRGLEALRGFVILLGIVILGAIVLSPVVAFLNLSPLPGDITFNWQNHRIFLPFTQSLIASVVLALLFLWARK